MFIPEILLLAALALLIRLAAAPGLRRWLIFAASIVCVFWLQPATPVRYLDFWLPTATLALTALGWLATASPEVRARRDNLLSGGLLAGLVLLAGLTRYLGGGDWLLPSRPPAAPQVLVALVGLAVLFALLVALYRRLPGTAPRIAAGLVIFLIALLLWLKTPALALEAGRAMRVLAGQNPGLATVLDVRWLGFSYVCFRLIHTLRDRQAGRLPNTDLLTYTSYVIFFPAFVAGPIDRLERFSRDFCASPAPRIPAPVPPSAAGIIARPRLPALVIDERLSADLPEAARRMVLGLFKKFALADTLALVALNAANAAQVQEAGWLWVLVYLYAFQIFLDFSGYTDVAIGLGLLLGIKLPENFAAPYLKPNLTQFWNSWHMSLTLWFRAYFFNPFVRYLRGRKLSPAAVLFLTQVCTMLLIGLWHGVTVNFVIWGLWHGLGLFVQNRWTELVRPWFAARSLSPAAARALQIFSTLLTFHYVALGWVWFALPTPALAVQVTGRLFGIGW